ncbi:MAG: hemerythrin domain-containing protein, partial [Pseudonocardia sp.]|nr:hemerythrin domain-containing protein [Pseudonocardia sp.]
MDALTLLRDDHREVLAMLEELERQPTDGTSDERADRKRLVTELIMASSAHEAVEEQYLWPSVVH